MRLLHHRIRAEEKCMRGRIAVIPCAVDMIPMPVQLRQIPCVRDLLPVRPRSQTLDYVTYGGTAGLEFSKDNVKLSLNYSLDAGEKSTQHGVYATFRYEF